MDFLRRLVRQAPRKLRPGGYLLLEASPDQMSPLERELSELGYGEIEVIPDLAGRARVIQARRVSARRILAGCIRVGR
jgi:release factor glutamine methyltransferase